MTAALNIPQNYAEELPQTIAELKAQQEYFNQLEIAAQEIQKATQNYNKLLEQGLTAVPTNNIDYMGANSEQTEEELVKNDNETSQAEEINQDSEEVNKYNELETNSEENIETTETENDNEISENIKNNEELTDKDETEKDETEIQGPKINLNSLLHKKDDED